MKKIKKKDYDEDLWKDNEIWVNINSESEEIEVTDNEDNENVVEHNKQTDSIILDQERIERKIDLISYILSEFRQWASDLEYNEAYQHCRKTISDVLVDYKHPIWDDYRSYFPNELYFLKYISKLNEEQKETIFDNYWQLTIEEIKKKRENKQDKHIFSRWKSLLNNITIKKENNTENVLNINYISEILNTNLEKNKEWHKKWHENFYFLNKPYKSDRNWKTIQRWNNIYEEGRDLRYEEVIEYKDREYTDRKKVKEDKLWDKINWWKQW